MKAPAEDLAHHPRPRQPPQSPQSNTDTPASDRPLSPRVAQRLQTAAGNRAVSKLIAQRKATRTGKPAPPSPQAKPAASVTTAAQQAATETSEVETVPVQRLASTLDAPPVRRGGPEADPKFAALKTDIRSKQKTLSSHPPPAAEAAKAQGAAKPPQDDKEAQGKTANAEKMNAAKPGEFDKAAFIKAVNDAIAAQAPKNLDEADKFGDSGKAAAVKEQVSGQVATGKTASAGPIGTATKAPPDTSAAKEKTVTPLRPDQPPRTPAAPDPAKAVPDKASPAATDFSAGPAQVDQQMTEAQVTEEQLAKSNEPEFSEALKDKKEGERHAATAPGVVRAAEAQTLAGAKAEAGQAGATAMTALAADRKEAGTAVAAGKAGTKDADEARRAQATARLQAVFDGTKKEVEEILSGLDSKVDQAFEQGEKAARDAFTADHKRRMDAYKEQRYSGVTGKLQWVEDQFAGLPEEANQIFVAARKGYVERMQQVISRVADLIGAELTRAKQRIAKGREDLQAEVKKLPADLQAMGKEAAGQFAGKFDELTESVDAKGKELVDTLASKYNETLAAVDEEINAEKEKNKGLIAKAVDAVGGVIKTILQLKDMLLGVLAKAASAVAAIIKDPIGFLGNLVSAVGAGLRAFLANIAEHVKKGLIGWLLGAMAGAGLELPAKFDLRGILAMVASLLGLTWSFIRGRIIAKGVPPAAIGAVEQGVTLAQKFQAQGIGGVWEDIKERVSGLKANLLAKISDYLIPTVLMAGITWVISLLNPASAFVKAVKMIIDIVTFILERGAQIIEFVNSVLDAVIAIAGGGAGGVPALIESALARSIPVLIGALAAILGISGVAEKVKKFFQSLSKPVMKAVDWVVGKIVSMGKKLWAKLKRKPGRKNDPQRGPTSEAALRKAARELPPKYTGFLRRGPSRAQLETQNERWRRSYRLQDLSVRQTGDKATIVARITPVEVSDAVIASGSDKLSRMIREVAMEIINDRAVVQQVHQILEDRSHGRGRSTDEPRVTRSSAAEAAAVLWETREPSWKRKEVLDIGGHLVEEKQLSRRPGNVHTQFERNPFGPGGSYTAITAALTELKQQTGATDAEVMQAMRAVNQGGAVPASISAHPEASSYLARVMRLWWQVEPGRNPASLVTGPMAGEIVASGSGESAEKIEKAVGGVYNPMAPVGAGPAARQAGHLVGVPVPSLARRVSGTPTARAFLAKEEQLMIAYISTLIESKKLVFADDADLRKFIQGELRDYLKKEIGAQMTKAPQP